MSKLSKDVLKRIKKEDGRPISKWWFVMKRVFVVMFFFVFTVLASFIFSMLLFRADDLDFDVDLNWQSVSIIYAFPYLWVVLAVAALFGAYFYFKKTSRGYRRRFITVIVLLVVVILSVGTVGYLTKFPVFFDEAIQDSPIYKYFNYDKYALWNMPDDGFLSGEIVGVISDDKYLLKDFDGKEWNIDISDAVIVDKGIQFKIGEKLKILGESSDGKNFQVEEVRLWNV